MTQDFRPGKPLPTDQQQTQDRQLYHAQLRDGTWATMSREGGTWQWRTVRGAHYGSGGWSDLQGWLAK